MNGVWAVTFEDGEVMLFIDEQDASNELWSYYMENYFEQESSELREAARKQFDEGRFIDGVGLISRYAVH